MPRNVKYLERFEYYCKQCGQKGSVLDVLLNPDVLLIRGFCEPCNKHGTYKVIDIEALRQEHEQIALAEGDTPTVTRHKPRAAPDVVWRWSLANDKTDPEEEPNN
jgi:hypothetical protein